ncbi:hypothetical protein ITM08_003234 [Salmonella enterica]|nr:hypothetical protein [Salmonella enterica]
MHLGNSSGRTGTATHTLGLKSAAARRELGVLAGELARGNFGALRGSGITLANRAGWIEQLMSPKGMMLGGLVGCVAAAVYGLGKAYYEGAKESETFNKQLILTGSYAGKTTGQLNAMAKSLAGNGVTQHDAAGVLAQVVGSGAFTGQAVAMVPESLDTLQELADALGNDPNFATTVLNKLAGKQPLDETLTALSGKSVDGLIEYVGLGETINLAKNAVPATRRVNSKPLTGDITLSAADVNAFALGMTGDTLENNKSVGWNWKSGVYNVSTGGASSLILHFNMNIGSCPAVQFCVNYKNGGISYRSARDDFGFELDWTEFYTTTRKPSAGDVGALPVSGGVINGNLGIGTPNILGGSSIVLGDNDTGLKQNGDGLLDIYANGVQVFRFQNDTLESKKSINVTGRLTLTDYGNFDSRYVQDIRLGSLQYAQVWNGPGFSDTSGYVITGITNGNSDELVDGAHRRPIQKLIGNQWYNVVSI